MVCICRRSGIKSGFRALAAECLLISTRRRPNGTRGRNFDLRHSAGRTPMLNLPQEGSVIQEIGGVNKMHARRVGVSPLAVGFDVDARSGKNALDPSEESRGPFMQGTQTKSTRRQNKKKDYRTRLSRPKNSQESLRVSIAARHAPPLSLCGSSGLCAGLVNVLPTSMLRGGP
jgi:hypothetical protein